MVGLWSGANFSSRLVLSKRLYGGIGGSRARLCFRRLFSAGALAVSFLGGHLPGCLAASEARASLAVPDPYPVSCDGRAKVPLDLSDPSTGSLSSFSAGPIVVLTLQIALGRVS